MIMKIAIAKEGFVDTNDSPDLQSTDTFLQCLEKILNFQELDLMEFDGNSCQIINSYDPTNSIFIYTNQQGTFLYTITSATPRVHKNNMIWDCTCYKMEDIANIENILATGNSAQAIMYKNIAMSKENTNHGTIAKKVEVKDNFRTNEILKVPFGLGNNLCCLKIKFMVDPTQNQTLETKSTDGSFNFFFPIKADTFATYGADDMPIITNKISDGNTTISLQNVLTDTRIKSVEFLPFNPCGVGYLVSGDGITNFTQTSSDTINITLTGNAVLTDFGVYFKRGSTIKKNLTLASLKERDLNKQLVLGGGARGFVRTPLGNILLDFETADYINHSQQDSAIFTILKEEGFLIDGFLKAEIPPHYINFYTDETGQLFIQNMTSNAQELRSIVLNHFYNYEEIKQNYALEQVQRAETFDFLNPASWLGTGQQALASYTKFEFDKAKAGRDYNRAIVEYSDKTQTNELLAKMTGRQLTGNTSILDFLSNTNSNFFCIFIEKNYSLQMTTDLKYNYNVQKDYDYSTTPNSNPYINVGGVVNDQNRVLINNGGSSSTTYANSIDLFLKQIFGYSTNMQTRFEDNIGLNYTISFALQNIYITGTETNTFKFTKPLNFNVRKKTKLFNFS